MTIYQRWRKLLMSMKDKIEEIFFKINTNETFKNSFYDKLSTTNNPFHWLKEINDRNLFYPFKKEHYIGCLNFFLNYSKNIDDTNDDKYALDLLDVLKPYLKNHVVSDKEIKPYYVDYMIIKIIFNLPEKYYDTQFVMFIKDSLISNDDKILISAEIEKTVLPKLIEYERSDLLLPLMEIISEPVLVDVIGFNELYPSMDDFWFSKLIKERRENIIELCGSKLFDVIYNQIICALEKDNFRYNIVSVPSIEFSDQIQFPDKYECLMAYLLRDVLFNTDFEDFDKTIDNLLKSKHSIFNRISLHVIDVFYDKLNHLFWKFDHNPILDSEIKHELYVLFKNNSDKFTDTQINKILQWIREFEIKLNEALMKKAVSEKDIKLIIAISVKEWLLPLLNSKNSVILEEYYRYNEINPNEVKHPGWSVWSSGIVSLGPTESKYFDFKDLTDEEIVAELNKIVFSGDPMDDYYENKAVGGFKKEVETHYQRYLENPEIFIALRIEYQNALFSKILNLINDHLVPDVEDLITYVERLIDTDDYWSPSNSYLSANVVNQKISDIFTAIFRDENNIISSTQFDRLEDLLVQIANVTKSDLIDHGDVVTSVLNSTLGNIYSAMLVLSLRRVKEVEDLNYRWTRKIKEYFTNLLKTEPRTIEYQVTLGRFLPNLYYLDKTWVITNLNTIFTTNQNLMKLCFGSYLFYSNSLHSDLYKLLITKGFYNLAMSWDFDKEIMYDRIVQHACVSYLNDIEKGKVPFLNTIIETEKGKFLSSLVWFIWRVRDSLTKEMKNKVIDLWEKLYSLLNDPSKLESYRSVISRLSNWLVLVDKIDEKIVEWCIFSASHLNLGDEMFFIEYLLFHVDNYPKEISEIMWGMMDNGFIPRYKEEDLAKLVEKIFENDQHEIGMKISNKFLTNNMRFIRPILAKY